MGRRPFPLEPTGPGARSGFVWRCVDGFSARPAGRRHVGEPGAVRHPASCATVTAPPSSRRLRARGGRAVSSPPLFAPIPGPDPKRRPQVHSDHKGDRSRHVRAARCAARSQRRGAAGQACCDPDSERSRGQEPRKRQCARARRGVTAEKTGGEALHGVAKRLATVPRISRLGTTGRGGLYGSAHAAHYCYDGPRATSGPACSLDGS